MAATEDLRYGFDLTQVDPASLGGALAEAGYGIAKRPRELAKALLELGIEQANVALDMTRAALGADGEPAVKPTGDDRRFKDRGWTENPLLRGAMESYLVSTRWAKRLLDDADLDENARRKARFALGLSLDALAPSNVPWLNPAVVKEAVDTGGLSLSRGFSNFLRDVVERGGMPSQVDRTPFKVGENLAATPGRVVYENDLMELIAYEPQTEQVYAQPFFYSPPWINKYYVMDLAPGRSFVEHAVKSGFTVFAISYRNPDASMAQLTLDDYLRDGWLTALERVEQLTGAERVNCVAVCMGGTLAMMGLGVLAARRQAERVGWVTLTNTLVDFQETGELGVFADERTIERIERRNARKGFLDSSELAKSFTWLRGNDLVWSYVVSNWLMGKQPPPFDILAWNADATRLPAAMHSQFLRTCYLHNQLSQGELVIDGVKVDLRAVEQPLYVLGAQNDHIAPWKTTYQTTQLTGGDARYVLSSGGHIAGMVNPPGSPKASFFTNTEQPASADDWLSGATRQEGSWWEDWVEWASKRSGAKIEPPALPDGPPAPGRYVHG